ncbi:hypothetical protein T484DRAFT_1758176, partial [Baffinella frigidus]
MDQVEHKHNELYTYVFQMRQVDERVKLWVDNSLIIDQWSSLQTVAPRGTVNVTESSRLYQMEAVFKHEQGDAAADLRWQSKSLGLQDVTSNSLFQAYAIKGSPSAVYSHPGV